MEEFLTNMFCFLGVYLFVTVVWQIAEILRYGKTNPNNRDTVIAWIISAVAMIALSVYRLL